MYSKETPNPGSRKENLSNNLGWYEVSVVWIKGKNPQRTKTRQTGRMNELVCGIVACCCAGSSSFWLIATTNCRTSQLYEEESFVWCTPSESGVSRWSLGCSAEDGD